MEEISAKQWIIAVLLIAFISFGIGRLSGIKSMRKEIVKIKDQENKELQIQNSPTQVKEQFITVYITGEVKNPDVYKLPEKSIVKDAIEKAGALKQTQI